MQLVMRDGCKARKTTGKWSIADCCLGRGRVSYFVHYYFVFSRFLWRSRAQARRFFVANVVKLAVGNRKWKFAISFQSHAAMQWEQLPEPRAVPETSPRASSWRVAGPGSGNTWRALVETQVGLRLKFLTRNMFFTSVSSFRSHGDRRPEQIIRGVVFACGFIFCFVLSISGFTGRTEDISGCYHLQPPNVSGSYLEFTPI